MTRKLMMMLALVATPATAQVTSLEAANQLPKTGNPDRIVCERQETTGTRLGARNVCLTVAQWAEKKREHRETVESIQHFGTSVGCQEGQSCP
jgi:hypothetical protein